MPDQGSCVIGMTINTFPQTSQGWEHAVLHGTFAHCIPGTPQHLLQPWHASFRPTAHSGQQHTTNTQAKRHILAVQHSQKCRQDCMAPAKEFRAFQSNAPHTSDDKLASQKTQQYMNTMVHIAQASLPGWLGYIIHCAAAATPLHTRGIMLTGSTGSTIPNIRCAARISSVLPTTAHSMCTVFFQQCTTSQQNVLTPLTT